MRRRSLLYSLSVLTLGGVSNHVSALTNNPQRTIGHRYCRIWLQEKKTGSTEWKAVALTRLHLDNSLTNVEVIKQADDMLAFLYCDGKKVFMPDSVRIEVYSSSNSFCVLHKNGKRVVKPILA